MRFNLEPRLNQLLLLHGVKMIKIKEQSITYEHPYGDLISNYENYIREFDYDEYQDLNILQLSYFDPNPWKAISKIYHLNQSSFKKLLYKSNYECPYTDRKYSALVPVAIFSNEIEKYFEPNKYYWFKDMACDKEWNLKDINIASLDVEPTKFQQLILGSGYTIGTLISDGSNSILPVTVDLDNGDYLYCYSYIWHNK